MCEWGEGHFSGHGQRGAERVWAALEALLLLLLLAVRECQLETRTISIMERIEEVIECKRQTRGVCGEGKEKRQQKKKTGQQQQQKAVNILMQVWAARGEEDCWLRASGGLPATC